MGRYQKDGVPLGPGLDFRIFGASESGYEARTQTGSNVSYGPDPDSCIASKLFRSPRQLGRGGRRGSQSVSPRGERFDQTRDSRDRASINHHT
jgi:hypothetical protein